MIALAGKQQRISFKWFSHSTKSNLLDIVYSDLCGPMKVKTLGNALYFLIFVYDHSRKVSAYALKSKDHVFDIFQQFQVRVKKETGRKLKCIHTDNGNEYLDPFDIVLNKGSNMRRRSQRHLRRMALLRGWTEPPWRGSGICYNTPNCQNLFEGEAMNNSWSYQPLLQVPWRET